MLVTRVERQVVLQGLGGDPDIVGGDWQSTTPEVSIYGRVIERRFFVRKKQADAGGRKKEAEVLFILGSTISQRKAITELGEGN